MIASAWRIQPASIFARSNLDFPPANLDFPPASFDFARYCLDSGFAEPIPSTNPDTLNSRTGHFGMVDLLATVVR